MRSRLLLVVVLAVVPLSGLAGCRSVRDQAHRDFVQQLQDEGGLPKPVAECVADRFLEARTTEEIKEFFERVGLTDDEVEEFRRLGQECSAAATGS